MFHLESYPDLTGASGTQLRSAPRVTNKANLSAGELGFGAVFGGEFLIEPAVTGSKEGLEGRTDCAFGCDAAFGELGEGFVAVLDDFVRGLYLELRHSLSTSKG